MPSYAGRRQALKKRSGIINSGCAMNQALSWRSVENVLRGANTSHLLWNEMIIRVYWQRDYMGIWGWIKETCNSGRLLEALNTQRTLCQANSFETK